MKRTHAGALVASGFAAIMLALTSQAQAGDSEIIVESFRDGYNHSAFRTNGRWLESQGKSTAPGLAATKSLFNSLDAEGGDAIFTPDIPVAGEYEVFVTYSVSGNAKDVVVTIASASGTTDTLHSQNGRDNAAPARANAWFSLGTYKFEKGNKGSITIKDAPNGAKANPQEANGRVYADAVRLVPKGFALPAEYANVGPRRRAVTTAAAGVAPNMPGLGAATAPTPPPGMPSLTAAGPAGAAPGTSNMPGLAAANTNPAAPSPSAPPSIPTGEPAASAGPNLSAANAPSLTAAAGTAPTLPGLGEAVVEKPATPAAAGTAPPLPGLGAAAVEMPPTLADASLPPALGAPAVPAEPGPVVPSTLPSLGAVANSNAPATSAGSPAEGLPILGAPGSTVPSAAAPGTAPTELPGVSAAPAAPPKSDSAGNVIVVRPTGNTALPGAEPGSGAAAPLPNLPGTVGSAPAAGAAPGLPPGSDSLPGLPGLPGAAAASPAAPALPGMPGLPGSASGSEIPGMPPVAPSLGAPGLSAPGLGAPAAQPESTIQWSYDLGTVQAAAGQEKKNILVFFVAKGNRNVTTYEKTLLESPDVRPILDKFVLLRTDFPQNTRFAYRLGVFGAGVIAIIDPQQRIIARIQQIPSTPGELAKTLEAASTATSPLSDPKADAPKPAEPAKPAAAPAAPAAPAKTESKDATTTK